MTRYLTIEQDITTMKVDCIGKSVAIPAISTGIFRFPIQRACEIAVYAVEQFLRLHDSPLEDIYLVTFMSDEVSECFAEMGVQHG